MLASSSPISLSTYRIASNGVPSPAGGDREDSLQVLPQLFQLATRGDIASVQQLLQLGSDPNQRDQDGYTPLHWTVALGLDEMTRLLLEADGDVNASSSSQRTPLHRCCHASTASILLRSRASLLAVDNMGNTPLHAAAMRGRDNVVETLLMHNANPNIVNNSGETPFQLASRHQHFTTANLLLPAITLEPKQELSPIGGSRQFNGSTLASQIVQSSPPTTDAIIRENFLLKQELESVQSRYLNDHKAWQIEMDRLRVSNNSLLAEISSISSSQSKHTASALQTCMAENERLKLENEKVIIECTNLRIVNNTLRQELAKRELPRGEVEALRFNNEQLQQELKKLRFRVANLEKQLGESWTKYANAIKPSHVNTSIKYS